MSSNNKICSFCNIEKDITLFGKRGLKCKECVNQIQREYRKKLKEQSLLQVESKEDDEKTKLCNYCNKEKNSKDFRINRRRCKDCEKDYGKNYNKTHKDIRDKWISENEERYKDLKKNWAKENRERINNNVKERLKNNPSLKIVSSVRRRLIQIINKKQMKTCEYIGIENDKLKSWLEFCFDNEMNWDNYGSYWHIDHVLPVSLFDSSNNEELMFCLNWKNLSPYNATKNLKKNNRLDEEQIKEHINKLTKFDSNIDEKNEFIKKINYFVEKFNCKTSCCSGIPLEH